MSIPYKIKFDIRVPVRTMDELDKMRDSLYADLVQKYPNTVKNTDIYATESGIYRAAYSDLLKRFNSLKSYIETLK